MLASTDRVKLDQAVVEVGFTTHWEIRSCICKRVGELHSPPL